MRPTPTWFSKKSGIAGLVFGAVLLPGVFTIAHAGTLSVTIGSTEYSSTFTQTANTAAQTGSKNLFGPGSLTNSVSVISGGYTLSGPQAKVVFSDGASGSVDTIDLTNLLIAKSSASTSALTLSFGYQDFRATTPQTAPTGKAVQMSMDGSFSGVGTKSITAKGFLQDGEGAAVQFANLSASSSGTGGFGPPTPSTFVNNGKVTCNSCFPHLFADMTFSLASTGSSVFLPGSVVLASADSDSDLPPVHSGHSLPEGSSSSLFLLCSGLLGVWLLKRRLAI